MRRSLVMTDWGAGTSSRPARSARQASSDLRRTSCSISAPRSGSKIPEMCFMPSWSFQNRSEVRAFWRSWSARPSSPWWSAMNRSRRLRNSGGDSSRACSKRSCSAAARAALAWSSALARASAIAEAWSLLISPFSRASWVSGRCPNCSAVLARLFASPRLRFCSRRNRSASSFAGSVGSAGMSLSTRRPRARRAAAQDSTFPVARRNSSTSARVIPSGSRPAVAYAWSGDAIAVCSQWRALVGITEANTSTRISDFCHGSQLLRCPSSFPAGV